MRTLQRMAWFWAVRCFGHMPVQDRYVRVQRLSEEVIELAQAIGMSEQDFIKIVSMVYAKKPNSDWQQELGGVMMTLAVLCDSHGLQMKEVLMIELNKVQSHPVEYYKNRNADKVAILNG